MFRPNQRRMKSILVPTDFSEHSLHAYRFALGIAAQSKGTVRLLTVIEMPVIHAPLNMPVVSFEDAFFKEIREKQDEAFKKLLLETSPGDVKVTTDVAFGAIRNTIIDYVSGPNIDLVVMGSHGAGGIREVFVGSNAEKIVRKSPVPVIVVKERVKAPIRSIVFPNTLETAKQEELVTKVKALQGFFKAHLHIVWINTASNFTNDATTRIQLEMFAKRFMLKDYTLHIYNDTFVEEGIMRFSQYIGGNLIAMGTHGRRGLAHMALGSSAEDIVNHMQCPIWTFVARK